MVLKDKGPPVFIATLFTIATAWNQPKCSSAEEWIRRYHTCTHSHAHTHTHTHTYTHTYIYIYIYDGILAIKKNEIMPLWTDLEIVIVSEIRQRRSNMTSLKSEI